MDKALADSVVAQFRSAFPDGAFTQIDVLGYGDDPDVEPGQTAIRAFVDRAGRHQVAVLDLVAERRQPQGIAARAAPDVGDDGGRRRKAARHDLRRSDELLPAAAVVVPTDQRPRHDVSSWLDRYQGGHCADGESPQPEERERGLASRQSLARGNLGSRARI